MTVGVLAAAALVCVWLPLRKRTPSLPSSVPERNTQESDLKGSTPSLKTESRQIEDGSNHSTTLEETAEREKDKTFLKILEREQVPLDFYGRVVDENGDGVPGATVEVSASQFNILKAAEMFVEAKKLKLQTDPLGNFSVTGLRGYSLVVRVEKDGYFTSAENPSGFGYVGAPKQNFRGDPQKPVVFRLARKRGAEPLLYHRYKAFEVPRDGSPLLIDLVSECTNSPTPDLKIQLWTDEENKDSEFRHDWSVRIEVVDGGIQDSLEEFDFIAPETGYVPFIELNYPKSLGKNWQRSIQKRFLLRLRNGQMFARMILGVVPHGAHFCEIEAWLNPSGSRNLEPDPKLLFPNLDAYRRYLAQKKQTSAKP